MNYDALNHLENAPNTPLLPRSSCIANYSCCSAWQCVCEQEVILGNLDRAGEAPAALDSFVGPWSKAVAIEKESNMPNDLQEAAWASLPFQYLEEVSTYAFVSSMHFDIFGRTSALDYNVMELCPGSVLECCANLLQGSP